MAPSLWKPSSSVRVHRSGVSTAGSATAADVTWRLVYATLAQQMMFDDDEVSGTPMTIPALVHEITCCLAAYLKAGSTKR